jgi:chromosome segregation ATPase
LHEQYQNVFHAHQHLQELQKPSSQQIQALSEELEAKVKDIIDLKIKLKSKEDKVEMLEKNLSSSEDKLSLLRQDYDIVVREKFLLEGQLKQLNFGKIK